MKTNKKIISIVSALSMIFSLSAFTVANAEGTQKPVVTAVITEGTPITEGTDVKVDIKISGVADGTVAGIQLTMPIDETKFDLDELQRRESGRLVNLTAGDLFTGVSMNVSGTDVKFTFGVDAYSAVSVPDDTTVLSVNLKPLATVTDKVTLGDLSFCKIVTYPGTDNYTEQGVYDTDTGNIEINAASVYPTVTITDITTADPVYTGKNVNLTAVLDDASKLGDRVITWTATNGTVTPNEADSTKAVLVPAADGTVTVKASVDNNGTVSEKEVTFTATTKAEPKPYVISATGVSNGETTITVKVDTDYAGENASPAYKLVAQFYTADGTAAGWVSLDCAAVTGDGTATYTMGAQNASTVSVTAYDADNSIVGQN